MSGQYPVVIYPWSSRVFWLKLAVFGGLTTVLAAAASVLIVSADVSQRLDGLALGFLALLPVLVIWRLVRGRFTFYETSIEVGSGKTATTLSRSDLWGYRQRGGTLDLIPRADYKKTISIPGFLRTDTRTASWFEGLTDLDRCGTVVPQALEQRARLDRLRRLMTLLNTLAVGAYFWGLVFPKPYLVAVSVVAAMPLIAVILNLVSGGLLRFSEEADGDKAEAETPDKMRDSRPSVSNWVVLPACVLAMRLIMDCQLLDWWELGYWAAGGGLLAALYAAWRDVSVRHWANLLSAVFAGGVYLGAVIGIADVMADTSAIQRYPVTVVTLHNSTSGGPQLYTVTVGPWGPRVANNDMNVTDVYFRTLHVGDKVCVYLGKGVFGLAWYELGDC